MSNLPIFCLTLNACKDIVDKDLMFNYKNNDLQKQLIENIEKFVKNNDEI